MRTQEWAQAMVRVPYEDGSTYVSCIKRQVYIFALKSLNKHARPHTCLKETQKHQKHNKTKKMTKKDKKRDSCTGGQRRGSPMDFPFLQGGWSRLSPVFHTALVTWQTGCRAASTGVIVCLRKPPWANTKYCTLAREQQSQTTFITTYTIDNLINAMTMATYLDLMPSNMLDPLGDGSCICAMLGLLCTCKNSATNAPLTPTSYSLDEPGKPPFEYSFHEPTEHSSPYRPMQPPPPETNDNGSDESIKRFACPFYQHDPAFPRRNRCCKGPGFKDISKLKEHLKRVHTSKGIICDRCQDRFNSQSALIKHRQKRVSCPFVKPSPCGKEVLDHIQTAWLDKRSKVNSSPVEKWNTIYRMTFGLNEWATLPSPYHESATSTELSKSQDTKDIVASYLSQPWLLPKLIESIKDVVPEASQAPDLTTRIVSAILGDLPCLIRQAEDDRAILQTASTHRGS
jgi:hypothetical protein